MSRWRASALHLAVSLTMVLALAALLLSTWYSGGLLVLSGAKRLLLVTATTFLVSGPLLTLLVFRSGKRGLTSDLAIIALMQSAFLAYGLALAWQSRPVFLVATAERIILVMANEVDPADLMSSGVVRPSSRLPMLGPELVGTRRPTDPDENDRLIDALLAGRDLPVFPQHYVSFEEVATALLAGSEPLSSLPSGNGDSIQRSRVRSALRRVPADARWVPITSSQTAAVMMIDPSSGYPLGVLSLDPRPSPAP